MNSRKTLQVGRKAQKGRTRQDLLAAGLRVLKRGEEPTLESVAVEADVSRATVYRYFPRIDALLSVLPLVDLVGDNEAILGDANREDPMDCALRVQRFYFDLAIREEMGFRRFLAAVLEESVRAEREGREYEPVRGSYRLRTLDEALASLENTVDEKTMGHLRVALVALSGIESLLVVKDVCGLETDEGWEGLEWAARTLVDAAQRTGAGSHPGPEGLADSGDKGS